MWFDIDSVEVSDSMIVEKGHLGTDCRLHQRSGVSRMLAMMEYLRKTTVNQRVEMRDR